MTSAFETTATGKWILAGEHSVLRGSPALVFPLRSRTLKLTFSPELGPLKLELAGDNGRELEPLFWAVLERACDLMCMPKARVTGKVQIESSIPIGAGLGASAAFCVAMTRWFEHSGWLRKGETYEFARTLEDLFHGESSGVDIAVAISGEGLHFERSGRRLQLSPQWTPRWTISFCGQRGMTADAVSKVKMLLEKDPDKGLILDQQMISSVLDCERALSMERGEGWPLLLNAVKKACECFQAWGLADGAVEHHMTELMDAGASAVKPTGSGGGGYVLALWETEPPAFLRERLIDC